MSGVATAIGGAAVLGYLGSQNAASAQTSAANQANQTTMAQFNQTRQDQLPWMNRGNAAGNQLAYLLGLPGYGPVNGAPGGGVESGGWQPGGPAGTRGRLLSMADQDGVGWGAPDPSSSGGPFASGPTNYNALQGVAQPYNPQMGDYGSLARPFSAADFQTEPGYQFRLSEGQKALERSAAGKGMSLSGAQLKALTYYNQGFASNEYNNAYNRYNNDQTNLFNRLSGIAGTGQQANQFVGQLGSNAASQVSGNQIGAGNAAAAGWITGANAINNGVNQWVNWDNSQNMWNYLNKKG